MVSKRQLKRQQKRKREDLEKRIGLVGLYLGLSVAVFAWGHSIMISGNPNISMESFLFFLGFFFPLIGMWQLSSLRKKWLITTTVVCLVAFCFFDDRVVISSSVAAVDPMIRETFIRELNQPLRSVYAIASLDRDVTPNETSRFGFEIQINDVDDRPERDGLALAVIPARENMPMLGPMRGYQSTIVTTKGKLSLSNTFVSGYESLDRLETGGAFSDSPFKSVGELDHASLQMYASSDLVSHISQIEIVANDYVIYTILKQDLKWDFMLNGPPAGAVFPMEFKTMVIESADLSLRHMQLNFGDLRPARHRITYGITKEGLSAITVLKGDHGWLPKEDREFEAGPQ